MRSGRLEDYSLAGLQAAVEEDPRLGIAAKRVAKAGGVDAARDAYLSASSDDAAGLDARGGLGPYFSTLERYRLADIQAYAAKAGKNGRSGSGRQDKP